jgi:hypothetical protein
MPRVRRALRWRDVAIAIAIGVGLVPSVGAQDIADVAEPSEPPDAAAAGDGETDDPGNGSAEIAQPAAEQRTLDPDDVAPADELPEGADFGPAQSELPPVLSPEEERLARERNYDPSEPEHPGAIQIFGGIGAALDSSLDGALVAHRYGESPILAHGDISFLGRTTEWLQIGGRVGARGRGWGTNDGPPALAGGIDLLAVAHARAYLGRVVDIGMALGAGLGWAGVSIQGGGTSTFAPRLHGSAVVAFRIASGFRLAARFAWDWFSAYDLDRYGSDLELGGPSLAIGVEIRR